MENLNIQNGCLPSPEDTRDYLLSAVAPIPAHIPAEMPRTFDLPISNQGSNPSCVGHACAAIRSYLAYKQGIVQHFDGKWIYQECKKIDGIPNTAGTYFKTGLEVMRKIGAKPLGGGNPEDWKIGAYAKVDDLSVDGLNRANFLFGAVLAGFKGTNAGWKQSHIRKPLQGETEWGHATAREGFGTDGFGIIQNSWGEAKGDKGIFYHPADYLPFEAWIVSNDNLLTAQVGIQGWCADKYLANGKTTATLNLRATAGLDGKIITKIPVNTKVNVLGFAEEKDGFRWVKIQII